MTAEASASLVDRIAQKFRDQGYEVIEHPTPDQLPPEVAQYSIPLLARSNGRLTLVGQGTRESSVEMNALHQLAQIVESHPDWTLEYVVFPPGSDTVSTSDLIQPAELDCWIRRASELLDQEFLEGALILGWMACEGALRWLASRYAVDIRGFGPLDIVENLCVEGVIEYRDYEVLLAAVQTRNRLAHALAVENLTADDVSATLRTARKLLSAL